MAKPGRKMACTQKQVETALRENEGKMYLAAKALDVAHKTLLTYIQRWPELRDVCKEEKGKLLDTAERNLYEALKAKLPWAICFFLKTQGKHRKYTEHTPYTKDKDSPPPPPQQSFNWDILSLETRLKVLEEIKAHQASQAGTPDAGQRGKSQ